MLLATFATEAVKKAIWAALPMGAWVNHRNWGKAQLVDKDISKKTGKWRLWLRVKERAYGIDPLEIGTVITI